MSSRKQQPRGGGKRRVGRPKGDDPRGERISVSLTESEYEALAEAAERDHRTVASMARLLILEALGRKR
jgi:hypothetical protein